MVAVSHPPPAALLRAYRRALKSIPAGGSWLSLGDLPQELMGMMLRERGDRVLDVQSCAARLDIHGDKIHRMVASPEHLPCADQSMLCGLDFHGLTTTMASNAHASRLAELARVSRRYLVVGYHHPIAWHRPKELPCWRHRQIVALMERIGFRPLARATPAFLRGSFWVAVFLRR